MGKQKKRDRAAAPADPPRTGKNEDQDEIDFPTVIWSLVILAVLVLLHRLIWGG